MRNAGKSAKTISMQDCYRVLKDCDGDADISWLSRLPMTLLSGPGRACMYAIYSARQQKPSRALSFMMIADGLADDAERPYVLFLRSIFESLCGNAEVAARIGVEAGEAAHDLGDKELEKDVLEHLVVMESEREGKR